MKRFVQTLAISLSLVSCAPKQAPKEKEAPAAMAETTLHVEGMHCSSCEESIATGVNALAGIDSISANHLDSTAFVRFDAQKTNLDEIKKAIEERGFQVVATK